MVISDFQRIFEDYGAALVLYARQWCRHPEDALQEAMLELMRQPTPPEDEIAWLFQAVRFRAINLNRSETRRSKHQQHAAETHQAWFIPNPSARLEVQDLKSALNDLPVLEREIVIARVWGGLSFEQIAMLVGRSISAVHRRYGSALNCLQQSLEGGKTRVDRLISKNNDHNH